jgi:hypothetical protein
LAQREARRGRLPQENDAEVVIGHLAAIVNEEAGMIGTLIVE